MYVRYKKKSDCKVCIILIVTSMLSPNMPKKNDHFNLMTITSQTFFHTTAPQFNYLQTGEL